MKFNWKKVAAAALAGIMVCGMFSGCKKGGSVGQNEIMYYFYGTEAPDTAMVMEKVNEKLKEKTGYTIKYKFLTSDNYDLVLNSGEKYDLVSAPDWLNYWQNVEKGTFLEITEDDFKKNAPYIWENGQKMLKTAKYNGKFYGIPSINEYAPDRCYMLRGDLMDKYGIKSIDSVDDLEKYLFAVAENEDDIIPFDTIGSEPYTMVSMFASDWDWAAVGTLSYAEHVYFKLDDPERKLFIAAEQPEYKEFSERMKRWMDKGVFSKSVLSNKTSDESSFKNGRSALAYVSDPWRCNVNWKEFQKDDRKNWDVRFYPVYMKHQRMYNYLNSNVAISSFSDKKEGALKVLNAIYGDEEIYDLFVYGIEGIHYNKIGDGKLEYLTRDRYWASESGIRNMNYTMKEELEFPGAQELVDKLYKSRVYDPIINMNRDYKDLREVQLALNEVYKTYSTPRCFGVVDDPDAALEKELAALKNAGIDKYVAEVQKKLDEYVKTMDE